MAMGDVPKEPRKRGQLEGGGSNKSGSTDGRAAESVKEYVYRLMVMVVLRMESDVVMTLVFA